MHRILLLCCLILVAPHTYAEDSWFDSALNFFGLGADEDEAQIEAEKPAKQTTTEALGKAAASAATTATTMAVTSSLASMVTEQLGVSDAQAKGGLGTLFGLAKSTLGTSDFSQLSGMVPEMDSLLAAAPAISENTKGLTSLMGSAGKYGSVLQGATQAYSQFKSLGIGVEQIPQYINVTNEFLESKGGDDAVSLFKEGISALLTTED